MIKIWLLLQNSKIVKTKGNLDGLKFFNHHLAFSKRWISFRSLNWLLSKIRSSCS